MSTATERIMRERGDLTCFHEPFMYDYYINRKVRTMPYFKPKAGHPVEYRDVRDMLVEQADYSPVFFKDMSYYVMPHLLDDAEFLDRLTNCFLIRNPVASIASYFKLDPDVTSDEIGLEAQFIHYDAVLKSSNCKPVVIEAEDIRSDTEGTINALWNEIGLPPADHAFKWKDQNPEDWKQVAGWHSDVLESKEIRPITPEELQTQSQQFEELSAVFPRMTEYLKHHQYFYNSLKQYSINN